MLGLELCATYPRPPGIEDHRWRVYGLREAGLVGLLRDPSTLQTFRAERDGLVPTHAYSLPPGDCEVAFHPDGCQLAVAASDGVHLLTPGSDRFAIESGQLGGSPRAVLFDRSGEQLWVSVEDDAGVSHACLLELEDQRLEMIVRVPLHGVEKSYHALALHPTWGVLAAQVSCGQDGTWASFVEFRDRTAARMPVSLERPGETFSLAGFAASGRWLAVLAAGQIQVLSWPDLSVLASVRPLSSHELFDWHACYLGDRLIGTSLAPDTHDYRLVAWNSDLQVEAVFAWETGDQRYLLDLAGLPGDLLLLVGDRRAGLLHLNAR
jgi:hypothetical protein